METQSTQMFSRQVESAPAFDLGSFEGFNFREGRSIEEPLTAADVIVWDHDRAGQAEFWPSGNHEGVDLLFANRGSVTGTDLLSLDRLLRALGDDSIMTYLRIYYAVNCRDGALAELTPLEVDEQPLHIFIGTSFTELRKEAALELFSMYYPDEFAAWEDIHCEGVVFDEDRFLDSPCLHIEEVEFGERKALIIAGQ